MRILVVTQYFWPEIFHINEITALLEARGNVVEVLTGQPNYPSGDIYPGYRASSRSRERWKSMDIHRVPIIPRGRATALRLALNYLSFVFSASILGPLLLRGRAYDVIFVYAPSPILQAIPALFLSRVKKIPTIVWVQDLWPESLQATGHISNNLVLKMVSVIVKCIYKQSDQILISSRSFQKSIDRLVKNKRPKYHPNSVNQTFADSTLKRKVGGQSAEKTFRIAFAGNLGKAQSLDTIIKAAELLKCNPKIEILIYGSGSQQAWMKSEVYRRGLKNVKMLGQFPLDEMPSTLSSMSALLVTLTDAEIFSFTVPNKIQAYMAIGRPIIASLNGEGADLINEANAGICVDAEDSIGLSNAITKLSALTDEELDVMGQNGRAYFMENFEITNLTDKLLRIFREVILARGDM